MPDIWSRVKGWLSFRGPVGPKPLPVVGNIKTKCPEIPTLENYSGGAPQSYWKVFPSHPLGDQVYTPVDVKNLGKLLAEASPFLRQAQIRRGERVMTNLTVGAPSCQKKPPLPSVECKNAKNAVDNGKAVSDMIGFFVKSKYVAGPFMFPPMAGLRVNGLIGVVQDTKVRPCLNVSLPVGESFNDNIDDNQVEKVKMTSARSFGFSVMEAGRGAIMSKFDQCDAYKIIPSTVVDRRLQGFKWLDRYFVETQQIFGASTAVANYNILGQVILMLAKIRSEIPVRLVHQQLDDVPLVGPRWTSWCEEFTRNYGNVCEELNVSIARDDPMLEKAFRNQTRGKVLGIWFDTEMLCWKLPIEKKCKALSEIFDMFHDERTTLLKVQKLLGRLNDYCLMCPFMRSYKRSVIEFLSLIEKCDAKEVRIPKEVKKDMLVWWAIISDEEEWLPIHPREQAPTLVHKVFTSDAAGKPLNSDLSSRVGVGCVGLSESGRICLAYQMLWDSNVILNFCDTRGKRLGDKTTTLEAIGVLLPFILIPKLLRNQHVVVKVDNMGVVWGWEKQYLTGDSTASVILRCILLLSALLETVVHVVHVPRCSTWEARMADRLSRADTVSNSDKKLLESFKMAKLPPVFTNWLKDPKEDWNFPIKICDYVENILKN
jgi:hypothetical protein